MKRPVLLVLLLTAIVLLLPALGLAGCTCTIGTGGTQTTATTVSSTMAAAVTTAVASASTAVASSSTATTASTSSSGSSSSSSESTATTKKSTDTSKKPTPSLDTITVATIGYKLARFEETDTHLVWEGSWTFTGGADDSGGSLRYAEDPASSVTAKFTGTSVSIITRKGLALGKLKVTLDSGTPIMVDCYSATPSYKQKVWSSGTLPAGTHYVRIECAGSQNPASGGPGIYVDALDITGSLQ
jgi:hyaluronate lyase